MTEVRFLCSQKVRVFIIYLGKGICEEHMNLEVASRKVARHRHERGNHVRRSSERETLDHLELFGEVTEFYKFYCHYLPPPFENS